MDAIIRTEITDQCALFARSEDDLRVEVMVAPGAIVAQGAPVLRSRKDPALTLVAPVAGEIASIDLGPGRKLSQVVFFHAPEAGRHRHDTASTSGEVGIRTLLLSAGLWPCFRSRPFGRMPASGEKPSAIFVMAIDTRSGAPAPATAVEGREEDLLRGLEALTRLTDGPVVICQDRHARIPALEKTGGRYLARVLEPVHPQGLAGLQLAGFRSITPAHPVWDIHAEDVAGIGALLASGLVPETRLVGIGGDALREPRLVRTQPGADLRALTYESVKPGPHRVLSGSLLDGVEGRWLGRWHRQVTAVREAGRGEGLKHWFSAALRRAGRPLPIIPTAALDQAFGGMLPAAALVRALASNDVETATRLGALSLTEEDVALADYVTGASPRLATMLRAMLDRIAVEEGT